MDPCAVALIEKSVRCVRSEEPLIRMSVETSTSKNRGSSNTLIPRRLSCPITHGAHDGNLRSLRQHLRQDFSRHPGRNHAHFRQLRMCDPCAGAGLQPLRLQDPRTWVRERTRSAVLLCVLCQGRRRPSDKRPRILRRGKLVIRTAGHGTSPFDMGQGTTHI